MSVSIEAGARAHFDRNQSERMDSGRGGPDGRPWRWEELLPEDRAGFRQFVEPIVLAALEAAALSPDQQEPKSSV